MTTQNSTKTTLLDALFGPGGVADQDAAIEAAIAKAIPLARPWEYTRLEMRTRLDALKREGARPSLRIDDAMQAVGLVELGTDYNTYLAGMMPASLAP